MELCTAYKPDLVLAKSSSYEGYTNVRPILNKHLGNTKVMYKIISRASILQIEVWMCHALAGSSKRTYLSADFHPMYSWEQVCRHLNANPKWAMIIKAKTCTVVAA